MQEIFDINEEFEKIDKWNKAIKFPFPVCSIMKDCIYFNPEAAVIIPDRVEWLVTTNYVVGLPTDSPTGYAIHQKSCRIRYGTFPTAMKIDKKIREGHYRLFKYKNGFCFKRNERIDDDEI